MARQVKVAAGRLWGYVAVVVAVTALARGYWRPWPDIDASGAEIGTSAYREPNGWYWVSPGQVISCMMSESETAGVYDKDTEYDDESGQQIQVAPGNINLNSMRWEQTGGLWVLEGNNNNSPDSEAYGQTVYWTPAPGEDYVCIRFASVDDETDDEDRDDDELEVLNVYKGFHVFRISGPDELWYWSLNVPANVNSQYVQESCYSCPLANAAGYYQWNVQTGLAIRQNVNDTWRTQIAGTGISSVLVKPEGKYDGLLTVDYENGQLFAAKWIDKRYPNRVVGINWAEYQPTINALFTRPFDSNRHSGKYYDENINQYNRPGYADKGNGYCSVIGYHLQDQTNTNVPYWYYVQEYFTNTNNGKGYKLWDGSENWPLPTYANDNSWGPGVKSTGNIWADCMTHEHSAGLVPEGRTPDMPVRSAAQVQYADGKWSFGEQQNTMSNVFNWNCRWIACIDCGRHNP